MTLLNHSWSLLTFSITVLSVPFWPALPGTGWICAVLALTLLSLNYRRMRYLSVVLLAMLLGIAHGKFAQQQTQRLFENGLNITIKAEVDSFFNQIRHGYEGTVLIRSINGQELSFFTPIKMKLISPVAHELGDEIDAQIKLKRIIGRLNSHGYDRESMAMVEGVFGAGAIDEKYSWRVISDTSIKQKLYHRIGQAFNDSEYLGLVLALTFGERKDIAPQQWVQMQQMGLIHLIAISGLHIQLVFALGVVISRVLFSRSLFIRWGPHLVGLVVATGYAWLSSFSAPTTRALLTCILFTIIAMGNLHLSRKSKWLLIFALMLALNPFYALSASFWMSFTAVATIYLALSQHGSKPWWQRALWMQGYLTLFLAPIAAYLFGGISLSAWLLNLLVVPVFSVVVMPGILLALLVELSTLFVGLQTVEPWYWVSFALWPLARFFALDLGWWLQTSRAELWWIIVLCALVVLLRYVTRGALLWIGLTLFWLMSEFFPTKRWQLVMFDVGHGLAIAIRESRHLYLYDVASNWPLGSVAEQVIIPWLNWQGVSEINGIFISHDDNDHAGGMAILREKFRGVTVLGSRNMNSDQACIEGSTFELEEVVLEVVWPHQQPERAYNPHSCVVRIRDKKLGLTVLLTGDIDAVSEYLLSRNGTAIASDVVIVPHHGSRTSSTKAFIETVKPKIALSSNAYQGRWNLPNEEVVKRYTDQGVVWYDTGRDGMLSIDVYHDNWQVTPRRTGTRNAWYRQMLRNRVE